MTQMRKHKPIYNLYTISIYYILFSPIVMFIYNTIVYNVNDLYPHKAQIPKEFNSSAVSNKGILACHGYSLDEYSEAFKMHPFTNRAALPLIFVFLKNY